MRRYGKPPFELALIVTGNCNLNCVYCYEHNKNLEVISKEVAKKAINNVLTNGDYDEVHISFFGGEPFLEFDIIKDICEWTWSKKWNKKYIFFTNTNGTLITEEIKEWTTRHKHIFKLGLSLDGTKETHNLNRCNSFDDIDLDFFYNNWKEQPVKMTISDKNLGNLANDIIFIHEKGFRIGGCNFAEGVEIQNFEENYKIISRQLQILYDYYLNHPEVEIPPSLKMSLASCEYPENMREKRCGVGENMAVIDIDGSSYPCSYFSSLSMSGEALASILSLDFKNKDLFIENECFDNCYLYPVCHSCYGDNYTFTGKLSKCSSQKCELNKLKAVAYSNYKAKEMMRREKMLKITEEDLATIRAIQKIQKLISNIKKK